MVTDQALLKLIEQKDAAALGHLYDRYGQRVYSLAVTILRDDTGAEEVTQDVFLKVWSHPERYAYEDNKFAGWLLRMTRNQAIDRLRQEKRQIEPAFSLDMADSPQVSDQQQTQDLGWQEMSASMHALPPEQRNVIVLTFYHGLSQSEIAEHTGWPLGTVKTRFRLGMEKLRSQIGGVGS